MITIKIQNTNDLRRISIDESSSLDNLKQVARELFISLPENFIFKYKDNENEFVTISCDRELSEAFQVAKAYPDKLIKIIIANPWLPGSLVQFLPFHLDSAPINRFHQTAHEIIALKLACIREHFPKCRQRLNEVSPKKIALLLLFSWIFFHSHFFLFFFTIFVGFKLVGKFCRSDSIFKCFQCPRNQQPVQQFQQQPVQQPVQQFQPQPVQQFQPLYPDIHLNNQPFSFQQKIKQLEEMGFSSRTRNIEVLLKHNGDLIQCVKELLE